MKAWIAEVGDNARIRAAEVPEESDGEGGEAEISEAEAIQIQNNQNQMDIDVSHVNSLAYVRGWEGSRLVPT